MPSLLTGIIGVLMAAYLVAGIYYAQRETQYLPAKTRSERRHRDEEFVTIIVAWPRIWWDDVTNWLGW